MDAPYQADILYRNYLEEVQRSGVLKPLDEPVASANDALSQALASSRYLARREFALVHEEVVNLLDHLRTIEKSIKTDIREIIREQPDQHHHAWNEVFHEFDRELGAIFAYAQKSLIGSLEEKIRRINSFTICLFGKTKAGKSTTMEALTSGKGDSIGKGRQNTTLTAEEYHWKGLTVVDTPGIDSMEEQRALETAALKFADGSDLVLFLMPHQIEEAEFVQFSRFYKQNKPIVILLNVKASPGTPGTEDFDDFLRHAPDEVFDADTISGYCTRIEEFIFTVLGIPANLVRILPVHSLSAFLARSPGAPLSETVRQRLFEISRFRSLENHLIEEVRAYGELYRIKNPYDSIILFAKDIAERFQAFNNVMEKQRRAFEDNIKRFAQVVERIGHQHSRIEQSLAQYFAGKRSTIPGVVDELFDAGSDESRKIVLENFLPEQHLREKIEESQAAVQAFIEKEIAEFFRAFEQELRDIAVEHRKARAGESVVQDIMTTSGLGETGDLLKNLGMATGVASGILFAVVAAPFLGAAGTVFGLGAANIWNPIGWGLMVAGIGLSVWGWSKKEEMKKKVRKAKRKGIHGLEEVVKDTESNVKSALSQWVQSVLDAMQTSHINVMAAYVQYADKHLREVEELNMFLDWLTLQTQENKFQSMVRRLLRCDSIKIMSLTETPRRIELDLNGAPEIDIEKLQNVLSRVEERPVLVRRL